MICGVVLAAGLSSRMGCQKMLLPFGGKTVIAHIIDQIRASRIDAIQVVVGHEGARIEAELAGRAVSIIHNPAYETGGMLSSVRCGLAALPEGCQAALVALGDQPAIRSAIIDQLLQASATNPQCILVPCFRGRRGHPLLIPKRFYHEIQQQYDDMGLRGLLQAHPPEVLDIAMESDAVLADMDTPEDYRRELARLENCR